MLHSSKSSMKELEVDRYLAAMVGEKKLELAALVVTDQEADTTWKSENQHIKPICKVKRDR